MADRSRSFRYSLAVQFALPQPYRSDRELRATLDGLRALGITAVELNIADPFSLDWADLFAFLKEHDLGLPRFASGLTAKTHSLSLSAPDEEVRRKSVAACRRIVQALAGTGTGVIIGFLKGPAATDREGARERFVRSLEELMPDAARHGVPLVVEATNRYESAVANSLEEAAATLSAAPPDARGRWVQILPDTFHMNIEETNMADALRRHAELFSSVHLSDNNRRYPGRGAIPFGPIIGALREIGWDGFFAFEGNAPEGLVEATRVAVDVLAPLLA